MSGTTRSCSQANIVPVRPNPVATSSQISRTPARSQSRRTSRRKPGRLHEDPGGALDERLDDHRRDPVAVLVEHALELAGVVGGDRVALEEERLERGVERVDAADRHGPDRVAVVGVAKRDEPGPPGVLRRRAGASTGTPSSAPISVALEPESEKKTRESRGGAISTSRSASSAAGSWVRPSIVEWATRSSCSRIAASIAGCRCPWTLHHSEATPSM